MPLLLVLVPSFCLNICDLEMLKMSDGIEMAITSLQVYWVGTTVCKVPQCLNVIFFLHPRRPLSLSKAKPSQNILLAGINDRRVTEDDPRTDRPEIHFQHMINNNTEY